MGKIYEILAVEAQVKSAADNAATETNEIFRSKKGLFEGQTRNYTARFDDGETFPPENKPLVSTVKAQLAKLEELSIRKFDLMYQKETANQTAKADLILNGLIVRKDVPVTLLVQMEGCLNTLRQVYLVAPTLEPDEVWTADTQNVNQFTSEIQQTSKQAKVVKPLVLAPATDKHPAQTQVITVDETVGYWKTKKISGKITPVEKARLITNIDTLLVAVKKARSRANLEEAPNVAIGELFFNFINTGIAAADATSSN